MDDAVIPALCHTADGQDDHCNGGHFDAAARGARRRADELQNAHPELGHRAAGFQVNGIHAGGTGGNGLEQRRHDLARDAQPAHGGGVVPLHQADEQSPQHPENEGKFQHHPGLQREAAALAVLAQLHPDHETQAARHDHEHDNGLHIIVVPIGYYGGIRPEASEQVKARVAERRDGRKDADPDALRAKLRHQRKHEQHGTHGLKGRGQPDDDFKHLRGLGKAFGRDAFAQQPQIPEAHPPPGRQRKEAGEGDKAEAAHLNEHQDDHLPEQRKLAPCIPHDEARHAGGTGGGEHGVDDAQPPRPAGNGQGKQQRPHRDDQQKAAADGLRRTAARQPALVGPACPLFGFVFSHCNLPGLPPASSQRGESFCRPCAKFPGAGASLYRIHLFSLRFNLILCAVCGIISVMCLSSSVG